MPHQNTQFNPVVGPSPDWKLSERRTASYERELTEHEGTEIQLRRALVRSEALLHEKDGIIRKQELLYRECRHRLLNNF